MALPNPFRQSVRLRLLAIALLPMLILLPIVLGVTIYRLAGKTEDLLIVKVNGDLTIAREYLQQLIETSGDRIAAIAESAELNRAFETGGLEQFLVRQRQALDLDFLRVAASDAATLPDQKRWPVMASAFAGRVDSAIDIFEPAELATISPALAEQALITLVPTRAATPTSSKIEDRGMVIHAAAPLDLPDGTRAVLVGGILLNRNLDFIDTLNRLVYSPSSLPEGSRGTATLFLDDVRISTNVRMFENERALGTRASAEVRTAVLNEGNVWLDRAFVVNDWYISGYEPVTDSFGNRVGMLYAGYLEAPFRRDLLYSVLGVSILFLSIAALTVPLFLRWAHRIFRPLEKMTAAMARVEAGELAARIGCPKGEDEISKVATHLDTLLDEVQERDRSLRSLAATLNDKVEERTRDLMRAKEKLEKATEQLVMSEKLAAIGEITASVAHEINNPVAVIQGNLDVARDTLGETAKEVKTEFDLIDDQLYRISSIISKLLQFARPNEFSGSDSLLHPADIVRDCLVLVHHVIESNAIQLEVNDTATHMILIDQTELQQVIVNLIMNAVHAMPSGGKLTFSTANKAHEGLDGIEIEIHDTGHGIDPDTLAIIFDPFFTTKKSKGTGLGLSISQSIANRAGGHISATSKVGLGSVFRIWLPQASLGP